MNQPVRSYPLRAHNEPAVFVLGDRQGQKVYANAPGQGGMGGQERGQPMPSGPMGMGFSNSQAMLAQQNSAMDALERRNRAERERSGGMASVSPKYNRVWSLIDEAQRAPQARVDDEDSAGKLINLLVRLID